MFQIKHLLQLISTIVTLGLYFNPGSTHAFELRVRNNSCRDFPPKSQDVNPFPSLFIDVTLCANTMTKNGIKANVLNLSSLKVNNKGRPTSFDNFLTFKPSVPFSSTSKNVYAYQFLDGEFDQKGNNKIEFKATVNNIVVSYPRPFLTSTLPARPKYTFDDDANRNIKTGKNLNVIGILNFLNLGVGNNLTLKNTKSGGATKSQASGSNFQKNQNSGLETENKAGACIVVTDLEISRDEAKTFCARTSIPEPSATITILTLGVLGGGLLLKRRRK
jgi:hypothetical protein